MYPKFLKRTLLVASTLNMLAAGASAKDFQPVPPPIPHAIVKRFAGRPDLLNQWLAQIPAQRPLNQQPVAMRRGTIANARWQLLNNPMPLTPGSMLLLRDGTVMVEDLGRQYLGTRKFWRLTPDINGNYANGTWSALAPLPAGYAPLYYSSAVLPDGRVLIEGGEYNLGKLADSSRGAIFDPVANSWTIVQRPQGARWTVIGDAPSVVLPGGAFMMNAISGTGTTAGAVFNGASLTWKDTGTGKADSSDEEGFALLQNDTVLTVDHLTSGTGNNSEIYDPSTGAWTTGGGTQAQVFSQDTYETGPLVTRPDGTVFVAGATGHSAIYDPKAGAWKPGPDFPLLTSGQYDTADAPAAVLPSGKVLIMASPGTYAPPSHFFVFDGSTISQESDPVYPQPVPSYCGRMLVLPTGQVLFTDSYADIEVYTDPGAPLPAWAPTITSVPQQLYPGTTFTLTGQQLNGLTEGSTYGDDNQDATNYPLIRIVNQATGHVFYAPTFGSTSQSIAPNTVSSTNFTLPSGIEAGTASLTVVANGIASAPVSVTISPLALARR